MCLCLLVLVRMPELSVSSPIHGAKLFACVQHVRVEQEATEQFPAKLDKGVNEASAVAHYSVVLRMIACVSFPYNEVKLRFRRLYSDHPCNSQPSWHVSLQSTVVQCP